MPKNSSGYLREDWQKHYDEKDLRWDIGQVSPPFVRLWEKGLFQKGSMLIPGCGAGHEVVYFADKGVDVTAVDFTDGAVSCLKQSLDEAEVDILKIDFFEIPARYDNHFDFMLEQTFFCAIHPDRRQDYVKTAHRVLKLGGKLVALFYETGEEGGPPYNTNPDQVQKEFASFFKIEELEKTPHSIERRQGKEWLGILLKQ